MADRRQQPVSTDEGRAPFYDIIASGHGGQMPNSTDILLRKLDSIVDLTGEDREILSGLPLRMIELRSNQDFTRSGDVLTECCLLVEGFMYRYENLSNGRRQILAIHLPGDIPDLQSLTLDIMDHHIAALVPCKVAAISHEHLHDVIWKHPGIALAFWRETMIDSAIFRAWITSAGRRSARGHLAHFLCEIFTRMHSIGLTTGGACPLPLTQEVLGDIIGLSTVHVNRTLMDLRGDGRIEFEKRILTILDWRGLVEDAEFDPTYLHLRNSILD